MGYYMQKVLIVEDSESFALFLNKALIKNGYDVSAQVKTGEAALEHIRENDPDVILMDINLDGELDGIEAAELIRREKNIPVIYVTSQFNETVMHRAAQTLPYGYLCKPFNVHHLLGVLDIALRKRQVEIKLEKSRLQAEQELRLAKEQWEDTFDAVPDLIAVIDQELKIVRANKALSDRLNMDREEITGSHCYRVIDGTDSPPESCPFFDSEKTGRSHGEAYKASLGGYFDISCTSVKGLQGGKARVNVLRDITRRKEFEENLRRSEELYRRLAEDMPNLLCTFLPDSTLTYVNQAYCDFFQKNRHELVGQKWLDFLPREQRHAVREHLATIKPENPFVSYEHAVHRPDGSVSWQKWHDRGIFENQELLYIQSIGEDITDRKLASERLKENEKILKSVLESIHIAMIIMDLNTGKVLRTNEVAREYFYADDSAEADFEKKILPVILKGKNSLSSFASSLPVFNREVKINDVSGRLVPFLFYAFQSEFQGVESAVLIFYDISQRKNLEMQLAHSQKLEAVGELAAGIAHEINTPSQYVGDNTRFLQEAFTDLQQLLDLYLRLEKEVHAAGNDELLQKIRQARDEMDLDFILSEIPRAIEQSLQGLDRVSTIVQAMKRFSHPGGEEERVLFDLNEALTNIITISRNEWKYTSEVKTDFAEDLPQVAVYPNDLNQAFLNLIVNAAQAIQEKEQKSGGKGVIFISTRAVNGYAEVSIQDTGKGIPEYYQDRIFDQFFTTKPVGKGTGQGLAITYSIIVDRHGGQINLDSREGEGTTFTVRLPLTDA
ncbi:multi-sensor signal transduction histidine kinase [Desulfonatronospira thiodismutans ASO3-1]|uniref:histidine kinase n=2 Tax=Desulfonatronospira thiodismutans TaxID=488939 RepID=D6SSI0_9BACT|nr:multi-sensor signal transduction histidine kinase [Desulfonatronospira thiodismutans ASO3-1]